MLRSEHMPMTDAAIEVAIFTSDSALVQAPDFRQVELLPRVPATFRRYPEGDSSGMDGVATAEWWLERHLRYPLPLRLPQVMVHIFLPGFEKPFIRCCGPLIIEAPAAALTLTVPMRISDPQRERPVHV